MASYGGLALRMRSATSLRTMRARESARLSPYSGARWLPAQVITSGTSSATPLRASFGRGGRGAGVRGGGGRGGARGEGRAQAADEDAGRLGCRELRDGQVGQRDLGAIEA